MWSARWGHTLTVFNDTSYTRNDMSIDENSHRIATISPILVLIGGDDYGTRENEKGGNSCKFFYLTPLQVIRSALSAHV